MDSNKINYEEDIEIDEEALDIACLDQPKLMLKYSRYAALKQKEADQLKEQLDVVKAGLDLDIRSNPTKYNLDKITEAAVTNTILLHREYSVVQKLYTEAKYEANLANKATVAFEQRKSMLETLTRLHGQQYFAGPSIPRDLSYEAHQNRLTKSVDKGTASKLNRTR